eukprot:4733322-Amphidinium_carterae.3
MLPGRSGTWPDRWVSARYEYQPGECDVHGLSSPGSLSSSFAPPSTKRGAGLPPAVSLGAGENFSVSDSWSGF